jgi:hypothetical protein
MYLSSVITLGFSQSWERETLPLNLTVIRYCFLADFSCWLSTATGGGYIMECLGFSTKSG